MQAAKPFPRTPAQQADDERKAKLRQLKLLRRQLAIHEAQTSFLPFIRFTSPHPEDPDDPDKSLYHAARHHEASAAVFEQFAAGKIPRLIFAMPPRHGKSEQSSRRLPAWILGRNPRANIAVCTYSDEFAMDFGADVRAICRSPSYKQVFPKFAFRRGGAAKDRIQTEEGGLAVFVGRGGALTGRGADFLIIDDLYKDDEEARSAAVRDQAWNWFVKVASTRLMSVASSVAIVMTRWHEDDIVGRLTDPDNPHYNPDEAASWKIVRLPAIAEADDLLGRAPGEALWPEMNGMPKFPLPFLMSQQRKDPFAFAALYQQQPSVEAGILFQREHIKYWSHSGDGGSAAIPTNVRRYCSSDHAIGKDRRKHDATVLLPFFIDEHSNIYVDTPFWERAGPDAVVEAMIAMAQRHKPIVWLAENGHISKSIGPFLRKRMIETGQMFNLRELTPTENKEQRAQGIIARASMGQLYFPRYGGPWVERAIDQLLKFPNGRNDDVVDALSLIGLGMSSIFAAEKTKAPTKLIRPGTMAWYKEQERLMARSGRGTGGW